VIDMVARAPGVGGPVAEVLVECADEPAAHGVGLCAVDHVRAHDLGVDALGWFGTQAAVLAAEIDLVPVGWECFEEPRGPFVEVLGEQGIVFEDEEDFAALVHAVHQSLLEDADVAEHAAPCAAALFPPGGSADLAAIDGGEAFDAGDRA